MRMSRMSRACTTYYRARPRFERVTARHCFNIAIVHACTAVPGIASCEEACRRRDLGRMS